MNKLMIAAAVVASATTPLLAQERTAARTASPSPSPVAFTVAGAYDDGAARVIDVVADRDLDGDGKMDEGALRLTCGAGPVRQAVFTRRDSGSALATGRRMHKPVTVRKGAALDAGAKLKGNWDLKEAKGARTSGAAVPVSLDPGQPDLCA